MPQCSKMECLVGCLEAEVGAEGWPRWGSKGAWRVSLGRGQRGHEGLQVWLGGGKVVSQRGFRGAPVGCPGVGNRWGQGVGPGGAQRWWLGGVNRGVLGGKHRGARGTQRGPITGLGGLPCFREGQRDGSQVVSRGAKGGLSLVSAGRCARAWYRAGPRRAHVVPKGRFGSWAQRGYRGGHIWGAQGVRVGKGGHKGGLRMGLTVGTKGSACGEPRRGREGSRRTQRRGHEGCSPSGSTGCGTGLAQGAQRGVQCVAPKGVVRERRMH